MVAARRRGFRWTGQDARRCSTVTRVFLFALYLGGPVAAGRMGEDHEVVFVVAPDVSTAKVAARAKWGGAGRPHIDAVQRIEMVDGHLVGLTATAEGGDRTQLEDCN
jgi:hypothetical protein